jgi:hypothetical protein
LLKAWDQLDGLTQEADPSVAIRAALLVAPKGIPFAALPHDESLSALWAALGPFPSDPTNLPSANKMRLRALWRTSLRLEKRAFLFDLVQHLIDLDRQLAMVGAELIDESLCPLNVTPESFDPEELELAAGLFVGQVVEFVVGVGGPESKLPNDWNAPLLGLIPMVGLDPQLLCAYSFTPDDLALCRVLSRCGVGLDREANLRLYPFASVAKKLAAIPAGGSARLRGILRRLPDGAPLYGLEVWEVDSTTAAGGRR